MNVILQYITVSCQTVMTEVAIYHYHICSFSYPHFHTNVYYSQIQNQLYGFYVQLYKYIHTHKQASMPIYKHIHLHIVHSYMHANTHAHRHECAHTGTHTHIHSGRYTRKHAHNTVIVNNFYITK